MLVARIGFQIDFDLGDEQISSGVIGGALRVNEWVSAFDGAPYDVQGLPEFLRDLADLERNASSGHHEATSSAFVFRGVSASATRPEELSCNGARHFCGDECVADQENSPATGCAQTCTGAPCAVPENASAYCSASAQCRFECVAGYVLDPSGTLCVEG